MADFRFMPIGGIDPALDNVSIIVTPFPLDAATDAIEVIFQAKEAAVITRLGFRYTLRTGTPPTYRISLQGVDLTTGNPDGTVKGGGTPASATFTPPASTAWDGTWQWVTLANAYTTTRGELLAFVIDYSSGTIDGSNNSQIGYISNSSSNLKFPYAQGNNAGVRSRQQFPPVFGYASAGTVWGLPLLGTVNATTINTGTTPDEVALKFTLNGSYGATFKVAGARVVYNSSVGQTFKMILYSGTTVLQDATFDTDVMGTASARSAEFLFDEASLTALDFGTEYRLGIQPQTATSMSIFSITTDTAAELDAINGGNTFMYSQRTDAGAWSDTSSWRPQITLILSDWSEPTGSGGGPLIGGRLVR